MFAFSSHKLRVKIHKILFFIESEHKNRKSYYNFGNIFLPTKGLNKWKSLRMKDNTYLYIFFKWKAFRCDGNNFHSIFIYYPKCNENKSESEWLFPFDCQSSRSAKGIIRWKPFTHFDRNIFTIILNESHNWFDTKTQFDCRLITAFRIVTILWSQRQLILRSIPLAVTLG